MVGSGAYGKVYRARMEAPGDFVREVAIKLLHEDEVTPDTLGRFRDEARILGLLQDRALVGVEPPHQLGDRWAVVMDFVPGTSAGQLLQRQGAFPPVAALEVVAEIARCLDKAYNTKGPHGEPLHLLHRDIKPNNIQITPDGEIKLLDFGIARADFEAREAKSVASVIAGTPGYIAPERRKGHDGPEGDVYSLGVVLWCLLSALSPKAMGTRKVQRWSPGMDDALALVEQMTDADPTARPTAEQVEAAAKTLARDLESEDLRSWVRGMEPPELEEDELVGTVYTQTLELSRPSSPRRSRLGLYLGVVGGAALAGAAGAIVMVGVAGIGAWFTLGPVSDPGQTAAIEAPVPADPSTEDPAPEETDGQGAADGDSDAGTTEQGEAGEHRTPEDGAPDGASEAHAPEPTEEAPAPTPAPTGPAPPELAGLDERLLSEAASERLGAIARLEEDARATPALHYLMRHDPDPGVREEAFYTLVSQAGRGIGDPALQAEALAEVLMDRLRFSQRKAAHVYGRVGTDLKPLEHVFFRGSPTARNECIRATVEIAERTGQDAEARALLEKVKPRLTSKTQQKNLDDALAELADP